MSQSRVTPAGRRRRLSIALVVLSISITLSACTGFEEGVGTTLDEFTASRAAAELATELEQMDGVGFVASDYDAVASRMHVQLVLTGDPTADRANWGAALDAVLAANSDPALSGSVVAATVLVEDGGGLALSTGALGAEATKPTVDGWLDLLSTARIDFMVERGGETGLAVEVSTAGLSGSESSARLDRVADAAGVERPASSMTASDLRRLLTALRGLDIGPATDSWFLPGLISVSGGAADAAQLDAVDAILAALEPTAPLAVTSTLNAPEGLFITTTPLDLNVTWHATQQLDALDPRAMSAWPDLRAIVGSIDPRTGASVSLMAPGEGTSFVLGTCSGTLEGGTAEGQTIVDALRADLAIPSDAITNGYCTPSL